LAGLLLAKSGPDAIIAPPLRAARTHAIGAAPAVDQKQTP